jgi:hypothetical protein
MSESNFRIARRMSVKHSLDLANNRTGSLRQRGFWLVFGGRPVQISAETPVNLAEVFRDSPKSLQGNGNPGDGPCNRNTF